MVVPDRYGLASVSPLDLIDLLPFGVEVESFNLAKSTVTVVSDLRTVEFWFATKDQIVQEGLKVVDVCIPTLFQEPKAPKKKSVKSPVKKAVKTVPVKKVLIKPRPKSAKLVRSKKNGKG